MQHHKHKHHFAQTLHSRARQELLRTIQNQEKTNPTLPIKKKVPNAIQKYHMSRKWYFWIVFGTFHSLGRSV